MAEIYYLCGCNSNIEMRFFMNDSDVSVYLIIALFTQCAFDEINGAIVRHFEFYSYR